jgi:hypothetical protein
VTSGTFTRVRLFTDVETITLEKWLDADNAGKDDLAKKILDAGLLVEHMIAEIPLEQNLADNSELKQLAENADQTFGLVVCFECNRAFDNKDSQTSTCPNCGAKLSRPALTPPEIKRTSSNNNPTKKSSIHDLMKTDRTIEAEKKESTDDKHTSRSKSKKTFKKELEKKSNKSNGKYDKYSTPSVPSAPVLPKDDEEEGWLKLTGQNSPGKHGVKSR